MSGFTLYGKGAQDRKRATRPDLTRHLDKNKNRTDDDDGDGD